MRDVMLVATGGAIGAILRHLVTLLGLRLLGASFPWWTISVNVTGSLLIGLVAGLLSRYGSQSEVIRLFAMTGILGGFTTFSAFSLDFATLWQRDAATFAIGYAVISVIVSLGAVFAGLWVARTIV